MSTRNVEYIISLRDKFTRNLKGADKAVKSMQANTSQLRNTLSSLGVVFGAAGVLKLVKSTVMVASAMEETGSKFDTVFSKIKDKANETAKILVKSYGMSSLASRQLLSDTGDLLTGFGFSQEMTLDLSEQVQKLAVDLASFTNYAGGAEGASMALTKALLGEREMVKSLGIAILESDVKAKVKAMDAAGKLKNMTERQKKAYATLKIAIDQSKNSIGDYNKTSGAFANQLRLFKSRLEDLQVGLGTLAIPALTGKLTVLVSKIQELSLWVNDNRDNIKKLAKIVIYAVKTYALFKTTVFALSRGLMVYRGILKGLRYVTIAYTRGIKVANRATKAFNATMKANIIGAVITGIILLVQHLKRLRDKANDARDAQAGLNEQLEKTQYMLNLEAIKEFYKKAGIYSQNYFTVIDKGQDSWNKFIETVQKTDLSVLRNIRTSFEENLEELLRRAEKEKEGFRTLDRETGLGTKEMVQRLKSQLKIIDQEIKKYGKISQLGTIDKSTTTRETTITSRSPKVININIQKLIETQEINTKVLSESAPQIKRLITQTIMEALNDTQIAQKAS